MILERLITIEIYLLGFKHITRKLHYDSISARSRFKDSIVTKQSVNDFMVVYKVQSPAYATILLSRPDHISAVKIIKRLP